LTPQQLLGGAAVIAGVLMVTLGRVRLRNKKQEIKN
jgi:drug/metabolite transporter (DMT)-like permease